MKKFLWAALLALPFLAVSPGYASAGGGCWDISGCWRIKICVAGSMKCCKEPFSCGAPSGGGCCQGGDCSGQVPGPWYQYWPSANNPYVMTAPQSYPGWTYDMHFQTPAPIYPFWPTANTQGAGAQYGNFQPAGYYPNYWYGR